jgi:ketosteroid isomerase-like protein
MDKLTEELTELENRLIKGWLDQDRTAIDNLLSEDWAVIDPSGRLLSKAEVLEEMVSGARQIESGLIDQLRIRLFGDIAVITGRTSVTGTYQGSRSTVKLRFTDVCERRNTAWQVVASQATLLQEK